MSRRKLRTVGSMAAIGLLVVSAAAAQQGPSSAEANLAEEMAGIRRSLDRLASLLETHVGHQRIELLIRRIELKERRLEPLEQRVREAESEVLGRETELKRMEALLEEQREALNREVRDGTDRPESDTRRMITDLELFLETEESTIDEARRRLRQLEDDLAEQREQIAILDETVLELLE